MVNTREWRKRTILQAASSAYKLSKQDTTKTSEDRDYLPKQNTFKAMDAMQSCEHLREKNKANKNRANQRDKFLKFVSWNPLYNLHILASNKTAIE